MYRIRGYVLGLALCAAGLAHGQQVTAERPAPGTTEMRRASEILGSTVQLNDGSGFGKVEDFVIAPDNRIEYLVVSHGNQYIALPWVVGRFNPAQRVIVYDVAPQAIQPLFFAPNAWPNFADAGFTRRIQTIFPGISQRGIQQPQRESLRRVPAPPAGGVVVPPETKGEAKKKGEVQAKPVPAPPPGAIVAPPEAKKKGEVQVKP
jgi:sporulation protein YlmC with PRC-barrel domain